MRCSRPLVIAAAAFVLALAAVACGGQQSGNGSMMGGGSAGSGSAASPGEAIFLSGVDASGASIPRTVSQSGGTAGGGMMGGSSSGSGMMGGNMMNLGCGGCHARDGHGRTTQQYTAPNITYANLTDPKGMLMPDGTRGPTYTDAAIQKAVTQGIDPTGSHLQSPMPQWQLTGQEWSDLLAYLKTLH